MQSAGVVINTLKVKRKAVFSMQQGTINLDNIECQFYKTKIKMQKKKIFKKIPLHL